MCPSLLKKYTLSIIGMVFFAVVSTTAQESRQDSIAKVATLQKKGDQALSNQDYDSAILAFNEAKNISTLISDTVAQSKVLVSLGNLNYYIKNYEKAAYEVEEAIILTSTLNNRTLLGRAYTIKGLIATRVDKFSVAEDALKKADQIFIETDDDLNRANVLLGLGILELQQKNYQVAINYFDAAIPTFKESSSNYQHAFALLNKAESVLELEATQNLDPIAISKNALNQANAIIERNNYASLKVESYKIAGFIAINEGDQVSAQKNMNTYFHKRDSLVAVYITAISKGVDQEGEIGNLNQKIRDQQSDIDKQQKSINLGKMTTGLSIALIIILSLLTLSLYKNNNLRAKANDLLQDKNTELVLAKEKAEKASLAKAQFLSTITHELRTPLYAVTGLTHLLLEEDPKEEQKDHLNSLKFSGEYLLSLINNILDLNKLEANKVEIEQSTFNLKKRINDVLVALKKSADDRKNNLHIEFDENIPTKLIGDPLKLSQVLINLIGNSVKFTQNGDVTIRVQRIDNKENRAALRFEIEDNGVGISKKKQKSIFESFSQASLQINRKFGGTGLGLSIVKNLLELMDSKIYLESQLGKGSKFSFTINFGIAEELKDAKSPANATYEIDYAALENRNVLVVEDNKINQMITRKILEKNKMVCMVADNGTDAVALVKENNYDIVLMDIHMPGISGIEATQKIREFDKELPIIALTAVTIDENLDEFYRAGFNEIIPKPFKTEEFFQKIYLTIENRKVPTT
ncbi:response regulator [Jejudonia soesokkakensis]|uniref:histidine kinase n=1 Tax=Jejudonia soesokkakensis TaxID=1323432 RepID=A0ABW2MW45_9FLAO